MGCPAAAGRPRARSRIRLTGSSLAGRLAPFSPRLPMTAELVTVVRGVDAVLPTGRRTCDIGIATDGTVARIGDPGTVSAPRVHEAAGLVAIPGGVDLHVHLDTYFGGTTTRDDFTTGTRA